MGFLGVVVAISAVTAVVFYLMKKYQWIKQNLDNIQGPTALPFLGNIHQFKFAPDRKFIQRINVLETLRR